MRIGIVTYDFSPAIGGLGVVALQTKQMLEKLFPDDTLLTISPSENADDRVSLLAASRWKKPGGCPLFSLMLFFKLPFLIRKHRLDLVHVHAGSGGVFLVRKPSRPLVVTAHHTYLQEAEIVFRKAPLKRIWKRIMSAFEKRTYSLADKVVCVSQDTADFIVERYGQPRSKVTVIENAVADLPVHPSVPKSENTILFVGRLEERKGVDTLLSAMTLLRSDFPDARLRLIGQNLLGNDLLRTIAEKGISDIVTLTGYVFDPLLSEEMARATVLVVPSLLEGFGLIAAQGMLAGTCVIASDAPGLRSVVRDKQTGLLFKTGNAADCARAIKEILSNRTLRQMLEKQARVDALKRFSPEARARELHQVFQKERGRG